MKSNNITANCKWCGTPVSETGPCGQCGKVGKIVHAKLNDGIKLSDTFNWEHRKTYYSQHKLASALNFLISFGSPFLGLWITGWTGVLVGLLFGLVSYLLGPYVTSKVVEITKG